MRTTVLSIGALAMGLASAHEYPNCVRHPGPVGTGSVYTMIIRC